MKSGNFDEYELPPTLPGTMAFLDRGRSHNLDQAMRDLGGFRDQRCLWVDLAVVESNIAYLLRKCGGKSKMMGMLKALAYGTELTKQVAWMADAGIDSIGVSSTGEGIAVRKNGWERDIYVFLSDREDIQDIQRYRLTPVIYSVALLEFFASSLSGTDNILDFHLKINTGMNRTGVPVGSVIGVARRALLSRNLRMTGVCTHFASADDPEQDVFTRRQIAAFNDILMALRAEGFNEMFVHAANTAAAIRFPDAHYDAIRVGLGLYGICPSKDVRAAADLKLAIGVTSKIASIVSVPAGCSVGYGRSYFATRDIRAAVIPFGYEDGLPRSLSNCGRVLVEGRPARILGRISMDQALIDISDIEGIDVGAKVLIYGTHGGHVLAPEDVAEQAGTIPHELMVRLGNRVNRVFLLP